MLIKRKERVAVLSEEKFANHPYVFPGIGKFKVPQSVEEVLHQAIIGKSMSFVKAYASTDRRSDWTMVRAKGVDLYNPETVDVPEDIVALQEKLKEMIEQEEVDLEEKGRVTRELDRYFDNES